MLLKCPECDLPVSSKALTCPHCGYPLAPNATSRKRTTSKRHMRLPNGFGEISEIKGKNLRRPFRAMVPVGKSPEGKILVKTLTPQGYFESYNEAYAALVEYHKNPYDLDAAKISMKELYEKWFPEYERSVKSQTTVGIIKAAWKYCSSIYDLPVKEIRPRHVKYCMEEGTLTYRGETRKASVSMQLRIKSMLNNMLDYAVEKEIVDKNYARNVTGMKELKEKEEKSKEHHIAFTPEEISVLWRHTDMPYIAAILINIYSGWRPQELGNIVLDHTDLENWTFSGGMKTEAGHRTVPIHSKIKELVKIEKETAESLGCNYLIPYYTGRPNRSSDPYHFDYKRYQTEFYKIMKALNLNDQHKPHDCRKTFITLAKNSKVDEYALKYMVGHKITDITEKTYTERQMDFYREEIEKIK